MKQHTISTIIVLVVLVWAAEKGWPWLTAKLFSHASPIYVDTIVLAPQAGSLRWQAVGTIKAAQDIVIESEVTGVVQDVRVAPGQTVKQGETLLDIRHDDILANLQKDQAILAQKKLYYERLERIVKSNSVSQEQVGEALSEYQQAEAAVHADQAQLDKYIIKAPFGGVIGIWQVDMGQLVRQGDPLVSLTQLSPAFVDFRLPAKALGSIKAGDTVQFTSGTYPDRTWQGKLVGIEPQLDSATRSVLVRAEVDNTDGKLVPRLYGQVLLIKPLPPQLFIPQEAVIYDPEGASVYVLRNHLPDQVYITLGARQDNNIVVEKGLQAGDEVVMAGMMKLYSGVSVVVRQRDVQTPTTAQPKT
ncbi:MAG: hypothetical protein A3E85_00860 [Gammaproteobacteria bacterium RIFCSPHIGHO2_12_FULL_45_12]|nr:MAG: hypothetical protein A3E85_00860 [Gammaproteobacteria bacterium RIFCSPHIGHO2_12_FULL_45_12]